MRKLDKIIVCVKITVTNQSQTRKCYAFSRCGFLTKNFPVVCDSREICLYEIKNN